VSRRLARAALMVLPLALAMAMAGCGSTEDDSKVASAATGKPAASASAPANTNPDEMGVKFAQCMREHGIDMPDPEPGQGIQLQVGPGTSQEKVRSAMEACREYNPMADAAGSPEMDEQNRKFATCMRDNGVEAFPDPKPGQQGVRIDAKIAGDPDFKTAQQACQSILAGGR
jgi:hypothetical protein